jgi:hypothetical protein
MLEILCSSSCGEIAEIDNGVMVTDVFVDGTPHGSPVLADLDGDGQSEIIFAVEEGTLRLVNLDGTPVISAIPLRGSCLVTPIAHNIDSDPSIEVVAGSVDSLLFVVDLGTDGAAVEWPCAGGSPLRTSLHAQPIFGPIAGNLTLSGRLDALGDIEVPAGLTLTLERGADLRFVTDQVFQSGSASGKCEILVDGGLVARGTNSGRVKLGPALQPAVKNSWAGVLLRPGSSGTFTGADISGAVAAIECQSSDVCISECTFSASATGVKLVSSSPLIDSNVFTSNDYGISASDGSPTLVNNTVTLSLYNGCVLSNSCTATLQSNTISSTRQGNGLAVYSSSPVIGPNNKFEWNSLSGIYLSSSSATIDSCWIAHNGDCGIKTLYNSNPVVAKTSLVENRYGVAAYTGSNPVLGDTLSGLGGFNDIRENVVYALYNKTSNRIKAQRNWWGGPPLPSMFVGQTDYSGWLETSPAGVDPGRGEPGLVETVCPNPFLQSLRLSLSVETDDLPVVVGIYDVRGRLVKKMSSGEGTGRVTLEWDGLDMYGNRAASGTYFVSVASRARVETRKVVLLN